MTDEKLAAIERQIAALPGPSPRDLQDLVAEVRDLRSSVAALESLRPVWAYSAMSGQVACSALAQVWRELGVTNQTAAMQLLRQLTAK